SQTSAGGCAKGFPNTARLSLRGPPLMRLDAVLRRRFSLLICGLLGVAAYFQALGFSSLIASTISPERSNGPAHRAPRTAPEASTHETRAAPILARNPFDSATGPLDGSGPAPKVAVRETDPPCKTARVLLIADSRDPAWSFASIAGSDGKPQLRR